MKKSEIKKKLKVLQGNGIKAVILDVIQYLHEIALEQPPEPIEVYTKKVEQIHLILTRRYEDILNQQPEQKVKNYDLEVAIKDQKEGKY